MKEIFEGLKVADFSWVVTGPWVARYMADFGADVFKIESRERLDVLRTGEPSREMFGSSDVDASAYYSNFNYGKRSLMLNLSSAAGKKVWENIGPSFDVVIESYRPGVAGRLGIDYAALSQANPRLIMLSTSMYGQTGPAADFPGNGGVMQGALGLTHLTGWPDRVPAGPHAAFSDTVAPKFAIAAIAAALLERETTGLGKWIDLAQTEATLQLLAPELLAARAGEEDLVRMGNRDRVAVPNGVFQCEGDDNWIAISVWIQSQWDGLSRLMGLESEVENFFATGELRRQRETELEQLIGEWTKGFEATDLMHRLQEAGVPAGATRKPLELLDDQHVRHRDHFVEVDHPIIGPHRVERSNLRFSVSPQRPPKRPPLLGEHTWSALQDLGLTEDEIADFAAQGAFD